MSVKLNTATGTVTVYLGLPVLRRGLYIGADEHAVCSRVDVEPTVTGCLAAVCQYVGKFGEHPGAIWMSPDCFEAFVKDCNPSWMLSPSAAKVVYDALRPSYGQAKCECGAEKCRSNIHSSWCPKA